MSADHTIVAEHYADAIMQLAAKSTVDKAVLEDLRSVNEVVRCQPNLDIVLRHPGVNPTEKKQLIVSVFGGKVQELTLRLLELLADRRRLELVPHIARQYEKLWRKRQNIVAGTLYYAEKPAPHVSAEIKAQLQRTLSASQKQSDRPVTLELEEKEDKSLIGGYMLRTGDQIIDGSLKGRLQQLEKQLLSV